MKKLILLILAIVFIIAGISFWGYQRHLQIEENEISSIKIYRGHQEVLITKQEEIHDFVALLNQITYVKPYINNEKGYRFIISIQDKNKNQRRGKEIIINRSDLIAIGTFSYRVKNPESVEKMIEYVEFESVTTE